MYGCENWNNEERGEDRFETLEMRCWRICLKITWKGRFRNNYVFKSVEEERTIWYILMEIAKSVTP